MPFSHRTFSLLCPSKLTGSPGRPSTLCTHSCFRKLLSLPRGSGRLRPCGILSLQAPPACIGSPHGSPQKAPPVAALLNKGASHVANSVISHPLALWWNRTCWNKKHAWEQLVEGRAQLAGCSPKQSLRYRGGPGSTSWGSAMVSLAAWPDMSPRHHFLFLAPADTSR